MEQIDPRRHRHHDDPADRSNHCSKYDKARFASSHDGAEADRDLNFHRLELSRGGQK